MRLKTIITSLMIACQASSYSQEPSLVIEQQANNTCFVRIDASAKGRFLMLPIEEKAPEAVIKVVKDTKSEQTINVRLAMTKVDYYVPFDLLPYRNHNLLLSIRMNIDRNTGRSQQSEICWTKMHIADTIDTSNAEPMRPSFHHTPDYGWMNDPNGMFYLDGVWHLYYQYNPYGSMWGNMHWGHATSTDLISWRQHGVAIAPDALGTVFSGSCIIDTDNTAGFGKGAVVAMYTSAADVQSQSIAFSTDGGYTFRKYEGNPVLTADIPDFRDPKIFWHEQTKRWNLIMASGQEMRLYSSANLRQWKEESRFGLTYGNHDGVWECPDMLTLKIENGRQKGKTKWVLICNINPGGPFGGSATQYFVGDYDGHSFKCDDDPSVTKWMDYGKDHYATVSFYGAPQDRRTVMAWMSNWQYANDVPTRQYRSANSIARDLFLYEAGGSLYVGSQPAREYDGKGLDSTFKVKGSCVLTLANEYGEEAVVTYDEDAMTLSVDRTRSGKVDFSQNFPCVTVAPVRRRLTSLRVFVDRSSIEVFGNNGEVALTNLVFPKSRLSRMTMSR